MPLTNPKTRDIMVLNSTKGEGDLKRPRNFSEGHIVPVQSGLRTAAGLLLVCIARYPSPRITQES